jgi:hypothetical protein
VSRRTAILVMKFTSIIHPNAAARVETWRRRSSFVACVY